MCEYKFYPINGRGHIDGPALVYDEADDRAAITQARSIIDGKDIEIWEGPRLVAYLVPETMDKPNARVGTNRDQHP
jgi:hypothetical protein